MATTHSQTPKNNGIRPNQMPQLKIKPTYLTISIPLKKNIDFRLVPEKYFFHYLFTKKRKLEMGNAIFSKFFFVFFFILSNQTR